MASNYKQLDTVEKRWCAVLDAIHPCSNYNERVALYEKLTGKFHVTQCRVQSITWGLWKGSTRVRGMIEGDTELFDLYT